MKATLIIYFPMPKYQTVRELGAGVDNRCMTPLTAYPLHIKYECTLENQQPTAYRQIQSTHFPRPPLPTTPKQTPKQTLTLTQSQTLNPLPPSNHEVSVLPVRERSLDWSRQEAAPAPAAAPPAPAPGPAPGLRRHRSGSLHVAGSTRVPRDGCGERGEGEKGGEAVSVQQATESERHKAVPKSDKATAIELESDNTSEMKCPRSQ